MKVTWCDSRPQNVWTWSQSVLRSAYKKGLEAGLRWRCVKVQGPEKREIYLKLSFFLNRHFIPTDQWGQKSSAHHVWSTAGWPVSDLFIGNWGDIRESYPNHGGKVVPCRKTSSSLLFSKSTGLKPNSILSHLQFKMYKTADLKSNSLLSSY